MFVSCLPPGFPDASMSMVRPPLRTTTTFSVCHVAVDGDVSACVWSIRCLVYDTAHIFAGLSFGSSTASRSIISRPRRTGLCSGSMRGALLGIDSGFKLAGAFPISWHPHGVLKWPVRS
jgi:hypothetical protein